jgi:hypothetical protein
VVAGTAATVVDGSVVTAGAGEVDAADELDGDTPNDGRAPPHEASNPAVVTATDHPSAVRRTREGITQ